MPVLEVVSAKTQGCRQRSGSLRRAMAVDTYSIIINKLIAGWAVSFVVAAENVIPVTILCIFGGSTTII